MVFKLFVSEILVPASLCWWEVIPHIVQSHEIHAKVDQGAVQGLLSPHACT